MRPEAARPEAPAQPGYRRGLRARVMVLVAVGVVVPAVIVGAMSWVRFHDLDDELLATRRTAATAAAEHLDEELTAELELLQRLASSAAVALGGEGRETPTPDDVEATRKLLRTAYLRSQFVGGLFLLDRSGRPIIEEPRAGRAVAPPPDLAEVQLTLRDGKPRVTGMIGAGDATRTFAVVSVADWHGRPAGIVGGVIEPSMPGRARVLRHLLKQRRGHADVVDASGMVLASTERVRVHQPGTCQPRIPALVGDHQPVSARCGECHGSVEPAILAFAPLAAAPWGVMVVQPEDDVLATSGALPRVFPVLGAILLGVAAVFAWGAARSVTSPIAVLTAAAERIAAGGMDEPIPALGEDELGRLGTSVERMRASLRDLISRVARANEELERRVGDRTRELAAANAALRERDAQRQHLLRTVITAQEDERKRIARELHDETTQSLAVLVMGLEAAIAALNSGGPRPRLDEVKAVAVRTLEEVHRLIRDLRPSVLDDLGLFSALRWYAERHLGGRGIAVRCEIGELERRLPPEVEIALFRIGQETMNNIARHARAESVLIQLGVEDGQLRMDIEDDGQGFDPAVVPDDRPHWGLAGIRERAELLGGTARIESAPGKGARVEIVVPVPEAT